MAKQTKTQSAERWITSSEVARHLFCARALYYDRLYPESRQQRLWQSLLGLMLSWQFGITVLIFVFLTLLLEFPYNLISGVLVGMLILGIHLMRVVLRTSIVTISGEGHARQFGQAFLAANFGLTGRLDHLLQKEDAGEVAPVLLKEYATADVPYQAHVMQVIAHCLLYADTHETHPRYGIIKYGDGRTFQVDFDEDAVEMLSSVMDEIEEDLGLDDVPRNHNERRRCYACRHRARCDQSLFV